MTLWRIRATVDDRPGFLAVLTASLALRSVNILAVQVHTTEAGAVDDFLVDAPDALTAADLVAAVEKGRGRDAWVAPAQAQGLVDPPTQALALAGRLVRDPDALGEGLRQLLGGDFRPATSDTPAETPADTPASTAVVWRPAGERTRFGFEGGVMRLPDPHGGTYEVTRSAPDFTPAEYARAQAMVDLAGVAAGQPVGGAVLLLPDGTELLLRTAGPDDLPAVVAMHERCSARTRRCRYLGATAPGVAQLARQLDPARHTTLVAEVTDAGGDRVVAMANLTGEGDQAEVALLVEDGWQGRGVGTALLRRLTVLAARVGYAAVVAYAQAENRAVLRAVCRVGKPLIEHDGGVVTVTLPLDNREVSVGAGPSVDAAPGSA
jgi:GNAT superfamily N-acetyltransferase